MACSLAWLQHTKVRATLMVFGYLIDVRASGTGRDASRHVIARLIGRAMECVYVQIGRLEV